MANANDINVQYGMTENGNIVVRNDNRNIYLDGTFTSNVLGKDEDFMFPLTNTIIAKACAPANFNFNKVWEEEEARIEGVYNKNENVYYIWKKYDQDTNTIAYENDTFYYCDKADIKGEVLSAKAINMLLKLLDEFNDILDEQLAQQVEENQNEWDNVCVPAIEEREASRDLNDTTIYADYGWKVQVLNNNVHHYKHIEF